MMDRDQADEDQVDGSSDELLDLVWDLHEGAIDAAGAQRLDAMLLQQGSHRSAYVQFMQIISAMEWEGVAATAQEGTLSGSDIASGVFSAETSACTALPEESAGLIIPATSDAPAKKRSNVPRPLIAAICASLATVATLLGLQHFGLTGSERPQDEAPIAYLASAIGYRWGEDTPRLQAVGSPVNLGDEVTLQEGIAEFRLSSGVYLSVEGPAGLVLTSPNSVVLQYGKLTSHVPRSAGSLKVLAGASRLTASKGEFGVYLAGGIVDIHAFSGQVRAANASFMEQRGGFEEAYRTEPRATDGGANGATGVLSEVLVKQGNSLTLSGNGEAVKIAGWGKADETKFATRLPMAEPLPITSTYVDAVLNSKPAGYWRFESDRDRTIQNEVNDGDQLQVIGRIHLAGRADNHVVELGSPRSDGFLAAAKPTDLLAGSEYSLEVWLRPSHFHAAAVVMMAGISSKTQDERPGLYLGLHGSPNTPSIRAIGGWHPWSVRFLNRNPPSGDTRAGVSIYSGASYQPRRWQHIVAVKREADMQLYINAELVASGVDKSSLPTALRLIVGEGSTTQRTYPFSGQLDELALYQRALADDEIRAHFNAVRWDSESKEDDRRRDLRSIW